MLYPETCGTCRWWQWKSSADPWPYDDAYCGHPKNFVFDVVSGAAHAQSMSRDESCRFHEEEEEEVDDA